MRRDADACDNGDACDGLETCDPGTGICSAGVPSSATTSSPAGQRDPPGCVGRRTARGHRRILDQTDDAPIPFASVAPKLRSGSTEHRRTQNIYIAASSTSIQKEQTLLHAGNKRFVRIIRLLERGLGKDKLVASVANRLIELSREARDATQALMVP